MPMITCGELKNMPTLAVGQAADLKIDTGATRVWFSRCGLADGETHPIQIEKLINGRWEDVTPDCLGDFPLDGDYAGISVQIIVRRFVER